MKLDILTKFNYKKKMWITPKHPLYFESMDFKVLYGTGVFMHAKALNKTVNTLNNFELERLLTKGLGLTNKEMASVIRLARDGKRIIDDLLQVLKTPVSKYLFLLDLANVSMRSTPLSEEERQSIHVFAQLLKINESEEKLIIQYISYAFARDSKNCVKIYEQMKSNSMAISLIELKYYMMELDYVTTIEDCELTKGGNLQLVDQCEIIGTIKVPLGTTLTINNAVVRIYGTIVVDGGTLQIMDSTLIKKQKDLECKGNTTLITAPSYSNIIMENVEIDCRNCGTAIAQDNGNLTIKHSKIRRTSERSAIKFWGDKISIEETEFVDCFTVGKGAALYIQSGSGLIKDCKFYDCEAKNGGAIYTSDHIIILGCRFHFCRAVEYGAAIFYYGEIKSNITNCTYGSCYPEKEEIIQYIGKSEKRIQKEYEIHVNTILDCKLVVEELAVLEISNARVYVKQTIVCLGVLTMKYASLTALDIVGRDLVNLSQARGCNISYCKFDGAGKAGIFKASGARINIRHSRFINTNGGRAIFDPMTPVMVDCTFSYCVGGAIYTQGGKIERCTMVNCRSKSGAGILMYGSRGEIINCRFVRCISDFSGGAIDMSGTSFIDGCEYDECRPNNVS